MNQYYNIVTTIGTQKIASAIITGTKLNLVTMVVGDGDGSYYEPSVKQTKLKNEVYRSEINSIDINPLNPNWLTIEAIIPAAFGGFYIREVGVLDSEGTLIAVGKYCETYKPLPSEGTSKELIIRMVIDVDNVESVSLSVNGDISVVTQDEFKSHIHNVNHVFYSVATGTANNYLASAEGITEYFDGLAIGLKINVASTGASTLNINELGAKPMLDSLGNPITAGGLKAGLPYTLRYNGTNFIVQGKGGGGDATAAQLLLGKKATVDTGPIVGTMPDNGAITATLINNNQEYTIPAGFHNGLGKIKAIITNLAASIIKAGVTVGGIVGTFTADATALAADMISGKTGYVNGTKVTGTMPIRGNEEYAGWRRAVLGDVPPSGSGRAHFCIPNGAYLGTANAGIQGIFADDGNFVASNILSGRSIFGLAGGIPLLNPSWSDQKEISTVSVGAYSYNNGANYAYFSVPNGNYLNGVNWISHYEPYLFPQNIVAGANICGVGGSASIASLGGYKFATGTCGLASNSAYYRATNGGSAIPAFYVDITGFGFTPKYAIIRQINAADQVQSVVATYTDGLVMLSVWGCGFYQSDNSDKIIATNGRLRIPTTGFNSPFDANDVFTYFIFGQ